ncbi:MAG: hypothetical protein ACYC6H_09200 [Bellilinea sp.]
MPRTKNKDHRSLPDDLPAFAAAAAQKLGIDLTELRGWALRPDGSVVLLSANGMKFIVAPE